VKYSFILLFPFFGFISGCTGQPIDFQEVSTTEFNKYWYEGKAEVNSFDLKQARYGQLHEGSAVMIFVTEDFSRSRQVKLDNPPGQNGDAVSVLKLNANRHFTTGIYDYSMMQSVFTPVSLDRYPKTLKVTSSSQDWCGQSWIQLNLEKEGYKTQQYSYFESDGDQAYTLKEALLEDEVWTLIRLAPSRLPVGTVKVIPGTFFSRLRHRPLKAESAQAVFNDLGESTEYMIKYADFERTLTIEFSRLFPHEILGWKESYASGFGQSRKILETTAKKKKTIKTDYWTKNHPEHQFLRDELGIK
jgi:hypothetical protein